MPQNKTGGRWALLAVILGNSIFGFSFLFSKLALEITLPSVLIAVRFTVAFLVLNLIVLIGTHVRRKDGSPLLSFSLSGKPLKDVLLLALFQPVIYFIAENYGILYTSSAFAGIIIAVIPIAGILIDLMLVKAKVTRLQILCALVSVAGVAVTTLGSSGMASSVKGICFLLVAVAAGAVFYVYSRKAGENYSALERTYVMFGVGSVFYIALALIQCRGAYDTWIMGAFAQPVFWMSILYLSVFSSVMAFMLLNYGSSYVSVSKATLFANFTTVISVAAGVLVLHEPFTLWQGLGCAMILGSVYLAR